MQENENPEIQEDQAQMPEVPQAENEAETKDEAAALHEGFKIRLKKERQKSEAEAKKAEGLARQLDELQKKFNSGRATSEQSAEYVGAKNAIAEAKNSGIPPEALPGIIEEHMQIQKLDAALTSAREKDPELNALVSDPESMKKVSPEEFMLMKHLPNAPAVLKHLLTDNLDLQTLKATERAWANDGGTEFFKFVNNLSRQLDSTAKYPHPSNYTPSPSLDDVGSPDAFNLETYINEKY